VDPSAFGEISACDEPLPVSLNSSAQPGGLHFPQQAYVPLPFIPVNAPSHHSKTAKPMLPRTRRTGPGGPRLGVWLNPQHTTARQYAFLGVKTSGGGRRSQADEQGHRRAEIHPKGKIPRRSHVRQARPVISNPDGSVVFKCRASRSRRLVAARHGHHRQQYSQGRRPGTGHETSARAGRHPHRAHAPRGGEQLGRYFPRPDEADSSRPSSATCHPPVRRVQFAVWFNCGLSQRYGITGRAVGTWFFDEKRGAAVSRPPFVHASQLSAVHPELEDDLLDIAEP